ncbi:MAG: peptidase M48 [Verrucomicrobia bacterium]|nr:MAG: peptidase M48 [Verrucomicrobiota bacterium]
MILRLAFFSVVLVVSSIPLPAQQTSAATANTAASPTPVATPAGITDPEAATRAWLDTMPANEKARSDAYFEGSYWLILWNFLVTVAIALLLLTTKLSARIRDLAATLTSFRPVQAGIYAIGFAIIIWALNLPLNCYEGFVREHQYGMSNQTFGAWFGESLKALTVGLIILPIVFAVLYSIFRVAERTWWIWGTIAGIVLTTVLTIAAPVFIEPIFNKYTPLTDPKIRDPILALARANEIPVQQVFVVDQSRQTKRVSANVAGLAGTTRIALNDNLLNQCTLPEIREVMAHEMGHYVLNHGAKITMSLAIFIFLGFALAAATFNRVIRRRGSSWGMTGIADPAGFPLLMLIFAAYGFLLTPIANTMSRTIEAEADIFGLNAAREPDASATVALKLGKYRKMEPTPLEEFIFFDHPSGRSRIRMAMDWKAARLPCEGQDS